MTVQRLIDKLSSIEDKSQKVEVSVSVYNKMYPVAYCDIRENGFPHLQSNDKEHRIEIYLPEDEKSYMGTFVRSK